MRQQRTGGALRPFPIPPRQGICAAGGGVKSVKCEFVKTIAVAALLNEE